MSIGLEPCEQLSRRTWRLYGVLSMICILLMPRFTEVEERKTFCNISSKQNFNNKLNFFFS